MCFKRKKGEELYFRSFMHSTLNNFQIGAYSYQIADDDSKDENESLRKYVKIKLKGVDKN